VVLLCRRWRRGGAGHNGDARARQAPVRGLHEKAAVVLVPWRAAPSFSCGGYAMLLICHPSFSCGPVTRSGRCSTPMRLGGAGWTPCAPRPPARTGAGVHDERRGVRRRVGVGRRLSWSPHCIQRRTPPTQLSDLIKFFSSSLPASGSECRCASNLTAKSR
jgi:hypothetical protein